MAHSGGMPNIFKSKRIEEKKMMAKTIAEEMIFFKDVSKLKVCIPEVSLTVSPSSQ